MIGFAISTNVKKIYQDALQRVERAGGWNSIEAATLAIATNADAKPFVGEPYFWRGKRQSTNPLPHELELLQSWRIQFRPGSNGVPIIRLKLYGMHSTGTYDQPYYGIWVVCTNVAPDYIPVIEWRDHGMRGIVERKGPAIFEVR